MIKNKQHPVCNISFKKGLFLVNVFIFYYFSQIENTYVILRQYELGTAYQTKSNIRFRKLNIFRRQFKTPFLNKKFSKQTFVVFRILVLFTLIGSVDFNWLNIIVKVKKRLQHRPFPVNFGKSFRTLFLQNTSGRLLLYQSLKICDITI